MTHTRLPAELRERVLAKARGTPSPDARAVARRRRAAVALGAGTSVALLAALGITLGGRPLPFVALSAAGWALLAAATTWTAAHRGLTMLGHTRRVLVFAALAAAPVVLAWVMACTLGWPDVREPAAGATANVACLIATSVLSLAPLFALGYLRRGSDPVHPRATGAATFASAGAWGGALIDLHCGIVHPVHVALAHVMPIAVFAALGAVLGARLFGVTSKTRSGC
ncbi:MAG TPA: NrsF family protein [Polyangiaceae bacterium]|nr:NrsF family protein [Polyangiaceae bacterium]